MHTGRLVWALDTSEPFLCQMNFCEDVSSEEVKLWFITGLKPELAHLVRLLSPQMLQ